MGDGVVTFLKHRVCCKNSSPDLMNLSVIPLMLLHAPFTLGVCDQWVLFLKTVIYFRDFGKTNTIAFLHIYK